LGFRFLVDDVTMRIGFAFFWMTSSVDPNFETLWLKTLLDFRL